MATIKDVAKLAGVSVATVSRVLNENGYVNAETKLKVTQAIEKLRYEPNTMARGLASKKTSTIGLVLPDITNPFFPEVARGVEDIARMHGYTLILCNSDDRGDKEKTYIEVLRQRYVDGIIFASHTISAEDIEKLKKANIPLVVLDRAPEWDACTVIRSNNVEGARMAVEHLLEIGCKKIAHIYGPQEVITAKERLMGYEQAVKGFDWYTPTLMEPGLFQVDGGMRAAEALLERHPDLDGIFIGNDLMAVGALKVLLRKGMKVPEQVALCGFDGIYLTEMTEPEITTVAQPIYDMGSLAAKALIKKIDGQTEDLHYTLDVKLIPRASTRREAVIKR